MKGIETSTSINSELTYMTLPPGTWITYYSVIAIGSVAFKGEYVKTEYEPL